MQEQSIKMLFDSGDVKSATIVRNVMSEGWCLQFGRKSGEPIILDSQRVSPRTFKTLDSAFLVAQRIGFREIKVNAA
ncbi:MULTISPECIES: hypothetical protein [unclassified Oleiphilus]|mgnify:CR=1 FL=1|jgi:hypothetical protein|uniref:hypothetical protein n=1 Tax=unclassified Oleiphilus TaxID=2631174 RepID=UPI0007C24B0A|nr:MULTISPECIES: hypothetical protein [unclassified Oleiphilus]KZY40307.1 hypothetical protein A3732_19960 [Oleiphilus sp. HI0050]KZY77153.1 hypothetical protein A3740_10960 [Oleiphilus sp. HI0068]KZY78545.1 hypothetical protein A3741_08425 [Oleiphilus sp. HI0069]KZZ41531.1 hypothetical protein A3755_23330 [Oleiphilus sp. HI0085]KZY48063.1 hypothetical protein A3732_24395 [Oleiphilus sp. HI0050]